MAQHRFRFGIQVRSTLPGLSWADTARKVEDLGFSTLFMPDHFEDQLAPIAALSAAAASTTTLRIGALVFGNDYRHPVVLAKEMATLDQISDGRVEIGMGAGWMRTDYEAAGMPYDRPGVRIDRLIESVEIVKGLMGPGPFSYDGRHYRITEMDGYPKPVQNPPPMLIGGGGPRMLGVAARHADIVALTANLAAGEVGPDAVADSMGAAYDQKVARVREAAGERFDQLELSSLTMATQVTDATAETEAGIAELFGVPPELIRESPAVLVGSVAQIAETLEARRERWGFSYPVLQAESLDGYGELVSRLAGT